MSGETGSGALGDSRRVRAFSTTPAMMLRGTQTPPAQQRAMLLGAAKGVCDTDLRAYLAAHEHAPPDVVRCVRRLLACGPAELTAGVFAQRLNELRALQQRAQTAHGRTPATAELTRLLISASRVTRLIEYTSAMLPTTPPPPPALPEQQPAATATTPPATQPLVTPPPGFVAEAKLCTATFWPA